MSETCCARNLPSALSCSWTARAAGLAFTLVLLMGFRTAPAQDQAPVARVEEDWELVVGQPDADSTAPQVTCVISPQGDLGGLYASIELNNQTQPDFSSGGVHLQAWNGEHWLGTRASSQQGRLNQAGETVTWTQSMSLGTRGLRFGVEGDSTTWGHFGGSRSMRLWQNTSLTDLNAYQPSVSTANSGVGFAANRVTRLTLKEVRYYAAQGLLLSRDTTERVVYPK